jgi:enamine deaminase RidA (YjgF/YER057c/UK114 family)
MSTVKERLNECGFVLPKVVKTIALIEEAVGDLDRVQRVVKLLGMVNAVPNFSQHTEVINGCSDVFIKAFGERGKHARSAVGMASLPKGFAVEIEAIVEFA